MTFLKNFVFIFLCLNFTSFAFSAVELSPIYVSPSGAVVSSDPIQKKPSLLSKSKNIINEPKVEIELKFEPEYSKEVVFLSNVQEDSRVDENSIFEVIDDEPIEKTGFDIHQIIDPIIFDSEFFLFNGEDFTHTFEIGKESYFYKYEEPSLDVTDTGKFYGIKASYKLSLPENHNPLSFIDAFKNIYAPTIFKVDGRFAWGYVDYEGSGSHDNIRDYVLEATGTMGYEIPIVESFNIIPYVGIGYRYLNDDFSVVPDKIIDGVQYSSGYDRESKYAYIPIGLNINKDFNNKWAFHINLEYDYFLGGKQKSHFEDSKVNGVSLGYDVHEVEQEDGYGAKVSIMLSKKTERFNFFIEPFFNYWDIGDSRVDFITSNGNLIAISGSPGFFLAGFEPANRTKEYGLKIGAEF